MPVLLACPTCLQKIRAPETVLGKQIKCPQCRNPFIATDSAAPVSKPLPRPATARESASPAAAAVAEATPAEPAPRSWSSAEIDLDEDELGPRSALHPLPASGGGFVDFLLLKRSIAPKIHVALFYVGLVVILVLGLVSFVAAICLTLAKGLERTIGLLLLIATTFGTPFAVVVWRVFCEMISIVFRKVDEKPNTGNSNGGDSL